MPTAIPIPRQKNRSNERILNVLFIGIAAFAALVYFNRDTDAPDPTMRGPYGGFIWVG